MSVEAVHLPDPCVVVLVGPGASGKSSWAAAHFPAAAVVSSDALRAAVGTGPDDLAASADAFELLEMVVAKRIARGLTTVVDTLGTDRERRAGWLAAARRRGLPCVAVAFDTPAAQCRERNRARDRRIPAEVLTAQLRAWPAIRDGLAGEGFDRVLTERPVRVVPRAFVSANESARRQRDTPTGLRFGLHIGEFGFDRPAPEALRDIANAAEEVGFDAIYVMDHFRQIPQIGRPFEDFLESWTTLAWLAAGTSRVRLGTLVSGVTYRNVAHLGKIVATLDVLSAGRAVCGLGLAWFAAEHKAYGWEFPPVGDRYALLEDALRVLPLIWGKGAPAFSGRALEVPEALCYPRPVQERVPLIVGGSGEKRTLRLAARYADAANVFGDRETVRRKARVLREHCEAAGRDPAEVALTHLSTALVAPDDATLAREIERLRPRRTSAARFAADVNAGTVNDHIGRFRELADEGVAEVTVRLPALRSSDQVVPFSAVINAFR
ncbi:hypothetical protein Val02_31820 [Virgisporangium aliadipatigenens]|uniref:Luciferase-like domain-containing protein n=1 Tax=Virgisporangium aliadipatigenens TaxID=741659 RepID=A0A8J3YLY8_9ACTN|nr:TIGR03560 family F420-dependent LLM class oxidoreductase [Virgisporangium aliadipatigenens]GIJ46296.1 hypothetical protein Val02_31820 [Virgisporangium aliadipatigenens]